MNLPTKFFRDKIWLSIVIAIAAILSFLAEILGFLDKIIDFLSQTKLAPYPSTILIVLVVSLFFIACVFAAIPVLIAANEKRKFKDAFKYICEINLIYRDSLFRAFYGDDSVKIKDQYKLIDIETETLASVCQRISKIFSRLTARNCMVTFKVLTKEGDILYATTCSRSEGYSERDNTEPKKFKVNAGCNTAFDRALLPDTTGRIPHFHSADLLKLRAHGEYENERPRWERYYNSVIVVPVNCIGVSEKPGRNDVGLLCVDTKSRNRLNDSYHVEIMAALAYQMYNFISLMRGKYTVSAEKERNSSND